MSQSTRTFNAGKMQYRFLGRTGLKVSALSLGSWVTGEYFFFVRSRWLAICL
jgi:hypothetical protein